MARITLLSVTMISPLMNTAILLVSIDSAVPFRLLACLQWPGFFLCKLQRLHFR